MNFYEHYYNLFLNASEELRSKAKKHWIETYKEHIKDGYDVAHCEKMLVCITLAEDELGKAGI